MKKIDSYYYIMPKINSGSIKDLNMKNQNLKKIEEKTEYLWFWRREGVLRQDTKIQTRKEKIDKFKYIKIKILK